MSNTIIPASDYAKYTGSEHYDGYENGARVDFENLISRLDSEGYNLPEEMIEDIEEDFIAFHNGFFARHGINFEDDDLYAAKANELANDIHRCITSLNKSQDTSTKSTGTISEAIDGGLQISKQIAEYLKNETNEYNRKVFMLHVFAGLPIEKTFNLVNSGLREMHIRYLYELSRVGYREEEIKNRFLKNPEHYRPIPVPTM